MYFNSIYWETDQLPQNASLPSTSTLVTVEKAVSGSYVTVLTSQDHPVNKRYYRDQAGSVQKANFQNAFLYSVKTMPANGIDDLAKIVESHSTDRQCILIRGLPNGSKCVRVRRTIENFAEHSQGTQWAMLDFDNVRLPEGMDPLSCESIEWVISKLPGEFHDATYFYQYSASAGILGADGVPLKTGLNVHLFFWLDRRIQGRQLSAYLSLHCMETGFYTLGEDKGGNAALVVGVDPAPLRSEVQAHYIAAPTIDTGVVCQLAPENRQGLVRKTSQSVTLPALAEAVARKAQAVKAQLTNDYKRTHGYKTHATLTRVDGKVAVTRYSIAPNRVDQPAQRGRTLVDAKLSKDGNYLTLFFVGEGSPGSWYVTKGRPQLGVRHGDSETVPLKELSLGAHDYVRDELGWFSEVPHRILELVEGYLPPLVDFAVAKASLVLSPTGSGKTTATLNWIRNRVDQRQLVFYAGPTIALVKQMRDDLAAAAFNPVYYADVFGPNIPRSGVIVTTYDSLSRLLKSAYDMGLPHALILDEIHQGLDRCMGSSKRLAELESALGKAQQTLLLTGTLTDVQRLAMVEVCKQALGSLTERDYCCYEFTPSKVNPLEIVPTGQFDADLAALLEEFKAKLDRGESLPRVVLLLDTSKMEMYRLLIDRYGLADHALIVSRPESDEDAIEAARTSESAILIASPLFGLGLNFIREPDIFWARFDNVDADTNQIIQTVNRANRGQVQCQARIYGNVRPDASFVLPNSTALHREIADRLQGEASIAGFLETHLQLDRVHYLELRKAERNSQVSLSVLVRDNAIQNFNVVVRAETSGVAPRRNNPVKEARREARLSYRQAVIDEATQLSRCGSLGAIVKLQALWKERKSRWKVDEPRLERDLRNEEAGIVMAGFGIQDPVVAQKVNISKVLRLFGEVSPWISNQYARDRHPDWAKVEAEKTDKCVVLLWKLGDLETGRICAEDLSAALTRNRQLGEAFQALASNDLEFQTIGRKIEALKRAREKLRTKGGDAERAKVLRNGLELLRELLEPLGVAYGKKQCKGRLITDNTKPIVPGTWDLPEMILTLERQAARLRALPNGQKEPVVQVWTDAYCGEPPMPRQVCEGCVFFHQNACCQGRQTDWQSSAVDAVGLKCDAFKRMKIELMLQ
ncbi:DEAD/DEAH box helicase family protein [Cupriavidus campinensis]|uniref:DEAD/DEAH box helicase family protein n=1 Tax=Cupriavidus campinensis TaxID=151783 RepID=A0AAE9I083_9BURK|nr:DEAD/DEAH box helicase family protein [Cupriavidus campinensis]URF05059.1 DEAD/DEAH box helicase family protein [Cupriavidus campinensis]